MNKRKASTGSRGSEEQRPEKGHGRALAYDWLKQRIVSLDLAPGSTIDEAALVEMLGVSRTPLREAMVRLAAEGLVELLPNRGARVTGMDLTQLQEHLDAFELMQRAATTLAARYRPDAAIPRLKASCAAFEKAAQARNAQAMIETNWNFHNAIAGACGNRYIERMYVGLLTDGLRISRLAMAYDCYGSGDAYERHVGDILREHRALVKAVTERNSVAAAKLADSHSNLARKRVTTYLGRRSMPDINVDSAAASAVAVVA